jgi:adenine-specific DNA-methyltransferase
MQKAAVAPVEYAQAAIQLIAKGPDWLMLLCADVTPQVLDDLCALPALHGVARLVVYAPRPKALAALLAERGVEAVAHSMTDALLQAQAGRKTASSERLATFDSKKFV